MALTPRSLRLDGKADPCWAGYEQVGMKRKGGRRVPNCVPTQPKAEKDTEDDGKKYTKVVTNPETGRKNKVRYGAKGYKIAPGTDKGDRYCARSFGDMKSEGYDCSGSERNTPLCLSRAKWKCSGEKSRRDADGQACGQGHIARGKTCRKKGAFPTGKAIAAGLTAGAVGAVLLNKGSRNAILGAPAAARRNAQQAVTEVVHRATAKKPSMKLRPEAFAGIKPPSKTQRLRNAARAANQEAEQAIAKAAKSELERAANVGTAMYKAGKATRASLRSGMRTHNLTVEKLRRRYEPGYRPARKDNYIPLYAPVKIDPARQR